MRLNLNLDFFIPNRIKHGYGLTEASTDILMEMKPDLVITVDNGITAVQMRFCDLNNEGIKTIVTDHHLADPNLLPAGIVVNPNHPECSYPFKKYLRMRCGAKINYGFEKIFTGIGNGGLPNVRNQTCGTVWI